MKIRNDKDTTGKAPYKVISLIDNLSISGSYNFLADSLQLSNFRVQLRLKLPLNYTLNLSGEFDPYMYGLTPSGRPVRTGITANSRISKVPVPISVIPLTTTLSANGSARRPKTSRLTKMHKTEN